MSHYQASHRNLLKDRTVMPLSGCVSRVRPQPSDMTTILGMLVANPAFCSLSQGRPWSDE